MQAADGRRCRGRRRPVPGQQMTGPSARTRTVCQPASLGQPVRFSKNAGQCTVHGRTASSAGSLANFRARLPARFLSSCLALAFVCLPTASSVRRGIDSHRPLFTWAAPLTQAGPLLSPGCPTLSQISSHCTILGRPLTVTVVRSASVFRSLETRISTRRWS